MATLHRSASAALGAVALAMAVLTPASVGAAPSDPLATDAPCYNGVFPLNPNVNNCSIPSRPPRVLGSAPDQTAILNCGKGRWRAACISLFVNGGYGWYPGATLVPGYHP
jgi:hypothetical protein